MTAPLECVVSIVLCRSRGRVVVEKSSRAWYVHDFPPLLLGRIAFFVSNIRNRERNSHWKTEGHLELATWGTTSVKKMSTQCSANTQYPSTELVAHGCDAHIVQTERRHDIRDLGHFVERVIDVVRWVMGWSSWLS